MSILDIDKNREPSAPLLASTVMLVRDGREGIEVFCVQRNQSSRWLGGVVVFPGGKVDATDAALAPVVSPQALPWSEQERAWRMAAAREALEEAAVFPAALPHDALLALRARLASGGSLQDELAAAGVHVELEELVPFSRWVTPTVEKRRFDTLFFLMPLRAGQHGHHDDSETVASFWSRPADVLARFDAGEVMLVPPTHRSLASLANYHDLAQLLGAYRGTQIGELAPICPELVTHRAGEVDTLALTLPGDPEHSVPDVRVAGASRFVLDGETWRPGGLLLRKHDTGRDTGREP